MLKESYNVLADREWILTNGIGGYALGFGTLLNKRKYNGLLVSSSNELKRMHVLAAMEEKLEADNTYFYLDSNHYANCIYPDGHTHVIRSWLRPYPSLLYSSRPFNKNYILFKELFMPQGKNAVVIKYTNLGEKPVRLTLRPKFTLRDHHSLNPAGVWDYEALEKNIGDMFLQIRRPDNGCEAYLCLQKGEMIDTHIVYRSVYYPLEALRGYDSVEDIVSPVRIELELMPKESSAIVVSSESLEKPFEEALAAENYYKEFPLPATHPEKLQTISLLNRPPFEAVEFDKASYRKLLNQAAQDFIVNGDDIVAGFPWFGPWGRDTLISMEGMEYLPGGKDTALKILRKYGGYLNRGMFPNTFGEGGVGLNYDSVDAPLWYILRCHQFGAVELFEKVCEIILIFLHEDGHPFFVDSDGLIEIREGNYALTWMDAKIYGTPVTPRFGKPVEINALWFNALCAAGEMARKKREKCLTFASHSLSLNDLDALTQKVKVSFQKFAGEGCLADRIEKGEPVWEVRPNAVTALSLPFDCVDGDVFEKVWTVAKEDLLTAYGLRSLSPKDSGFKQKYVGNQRQRDLAYHQGTVWTYLLLPFARLAVKAFSNRPAEDLAGELSGYIWTFRNGFMKGQMASAAEVWDAVNPYFPKGCPAQAWSVFAILAIEGILDKRDGVR